MPRYYFDIHDAGASQHDEIGTDLPDVNAVRDAANRLLPDIAREEVPSDGDHRSFTVMVTDDTGKAVYSATLTYSGLNLQR